MIMQSTSWLDTRDPRLVELARMLPGIFIGTSIEMGKRLGWQSLNLRFQSAGRSELLRANDVDERSQLSILSFYYRGGCKQSFHPIPSSFWVDIAQSLMGWMTTGQCSAAFGSVSDQVTLTIQFTRSLWSSEAPPYP